jgi:D-alanine-D-alanine ligase|tara:strand:+ start:2106 stop:3071 length:966 start_codon:yes stop_codon:yes gene_type:complete
MKKLGIFCGGFSSEFDISMKSANTILANIPEGFDPFLIVVQPGKWTVTYKGTESLMDMNNLTFMFNGKQEKLDIGLVYIHGNPGENGKIQAFLEMKKVPFINSGALASELSFDKWFCNQFLRGFGIPVAKSILLYTPNDCTTEHMVSNLGLPIFVKPADSGSSFGISKVSKEEDLQGAIAKAFEEGETVVLESFLGGTEVTCGVYRNQNGIEALPITEIVSEGDFFDYDAKYLGKSKEITPARISDEMRDKIHEQTKMIYQLMRLRSIARIDHMIVGDIPYVIEVNTTPGFSDASIVPKMISVKGQSLKEFWQEVFAAELL